MHVSVCVCKVRVEDWMAVLHLSNYFEIINDQSISLAKVRFSWTHSMLYLYL